MHAVDRHEDILSFSTVGVCNRDIYIYIYIERESSVKRPFTRVRKIAKATINLFISVRLFVRNSMNSAHETIQLPLGEYSWKFMLEDFLKICHKNSGGNKIRQ